MTVFKEENKGKRSSQDVMFIFSAFLSSGVLSIILIKSLQTEMNTKSGNKKNMIINLFKITSLLEGLSYILLLFVGVPLKYLVGNNFLVKSLGMPQGLLFIAYIIIVLFIRSSMKWDSKSTFIVLIASLLPFGTFYVK